MYKNPSYNLHFRGARFLQGENPCQVLLVLPGLMSVRLFYFFLCAEAALVSTKEPSTQPRGSRNATVG